LTHLSWRNTDPPASNGLPVKLTDCSLSLIGIRQQNNSEARVLATLDVDGDVRLLDLEALKELNHCAFVSGPRKSPEFDCTFDIVFSDAVAASHILVLRVVGSELGVVLNI
jgi:hypothetical protein